MAKQKSIVAQVQDLVQRSGIIVDPDDEIYKTRHQQKMELKAAGVNLGNFNEVGKLITLNGGSPCTVKQFINISCDFAKFCRDEYGIKTIQAIKPFMPIEYLNHKLDEGKKLASVQNYGSIINKLSDAMQMHFKKDYHIRERIDTWRENIKNKGVVNAPLGSRRYDDIDTLKSAMTNERYTIATSLMGDGGLRIGCEASRITANQLKGYGAHPVTGERCGVIEVCGKGHRIRLTYHDVATYNSVQRIIETEGKFSFSIDGYREALRSACIGTAYHGPHGLRHTWASEMLQKCYANGMGELEGLKKTSLLLGHSRIDITRIYLR